METNAELTTGESPKSNGLTLLNIEDIKRQIDAVKKLYKSVMVKDIDYGIIEGTKKPSLLQPGAEKVGMMFRLYPQYTADIKQLENDHREIMVYCKIIVIGDDYQVGHGIAICSTMEPKYRFRNQKHKCPECGAEYVFKSKPQYGDGYYCYKKAGGCGATFDGSDSRIIDQVIGKVENEYPAEKYHTVLMMAEKRAYVKAIRTLAAVSDTFTQDTEDMPEFAGQSSKNNHANNNQYEQPAQTDYDTTTGEVINNDKNIPFESNQNTDEDPLRVRKEALSLYNNLTEIEKKYIKSWYENHDKGKSLGKAKTCSVTLTLPQGKSLRAFCIRLREKGLPDIGNIDNYDQSWIKEDSEADFQVADEYNRVLTGYVMKYSEQTQLLIKENVIDEYTFVKNGKYNIHSIKILEECIGGIKEDIEGEPNE